MNFGERFKLYLLGVIGGIFLVILFFGNRSSCKNYVGNYLPEGRVLQEIQYKPIHYTPEVMASLASLSLDTAKFRTEILPELDIDFDQSNQRANPCGQYLATFQDSLQILEIRFEKCKEQTLFQEIIKK